jgi:hypothetical protein
MGTRSNKVILVAGRRSSGKTSWVKDLVYPFESTLIVDTFDSPVWKNWSTFKHPERASQPIPVIEPGQLRARPYKKGRIFDGDIDKVMAEIQQDVFNTFIVFEDATKYVGDRISSDVKKFVLDSKQKNLDIIFIFHSLMNIPRDLVRYSDHLVLFKTNELLDNSLKRKFPIQDVWKQFEKVQKSKNDYINTHINIGS